MSWDQELGESIKRARGKKGWTQERLGLALGVHVNTIRSYEKGKSSPDFADIRRIADVLGEDHFSVGDEVRIEFGPNGRARLDAAPEQLRLEFDEGDGVNVRIESVGHGITISKLSA